MKINPAIPSFHIQLKDDLWHFFIPQVLREVYVSKATNLILDCGMDIMAEVLQQAQQVGMVSEEYYYLITSLDTHTVEMDDFKVRELGILL